MAVPTDTADRKDPLRSALGVPATLREWLTLKETIEALEKSSTTVERLVASQRLRSKLEPRPGRKAERVYHAGDVERLKRAEEEGRRQPALVLPKAPPVPAVPAPLALAPETRDLARELMERLAGPRPVALTEKLWLNLDEAAEYSGLARTFLRDSCVEPEHYKEGENLIGIRGGPHNALRIQRKSLEAFQG